MVPSPHSRTRKQNPEIIEQHLWYMNMALEMTEQAWKHNEVPIGCLIVSQGKILAKTHNFKETHHDPCAHAEILALGLAGKVHGGWRLSGATLYVTLEPCLMCLYACLQARIQTLVFGAFDKKGGAISLGYLPHRDIRINHKLDVIGGVLAYKSGQILSSFFKQLRKKHQLKNI